MIEQQGSHCRLSGDITIDTVPGLQNEIRSLIRSGVDTLDCAGINNVDSSALGFLLVCKREARQQNHPLNIVKLPASLLSLASLYGIVGQLAA